MLLSFSTLMIATLLICVACTVFAVWYYDKIHTLAGYIETKRLVSNVQHIPPSTATRWVMRRLKITVVYYSSGDYYKLRLKGLLFGGRDLRVNQDSYGYCEMASYISSKEEAMEHVVAIFEDVEQWDQIGDNPPDWAGRVIEEASALRRKEQE